MKVQRLLILGTRGVPAAHGGFETFAEHFSLHLAQRGWHVTVYCQDDGEGPQYRDDWSGVDRVHIPIKTGGAAGTILFDWKSTLHALNEPGLVLTLGYNTAIFTLLYRLKGKRNLINMDGIEWRRQKWGLPAKIWFWMNDWLGSLLGNHLIADHPEILKHLTTRVSEKKITMIPYGSDVVEQANESLLSSYGLSPGGYAVLIARAEPENSILEVVRAWSRKHRNVKLVILGKYSQEHDYQKTVMQSASDEVVFPGAIYEKPVVNALRFFARFYIHGHQVGGTNPSLVESLGAGNAILAHDNKYNRWVASDAALYFHDDDSCSTAIENLLSDNELLSKLKRASHSRHTELFTWDKVLSDYEALVSVWL